MQTIPQPPPMFNRPRDLAFYLNDWMQFMGFAPEVRAAELRRVSSLVWTLANPTADALEEFAAQITPAVEDDEPCEYSLGDIDGFERGTPIGVDEVCAIFDPSEVLEEAWARS